MPRKATPEERMEREKERLKRIEAQALRVRRRLSTLQRHQQEVERKADTRRKILLGALVMEYADQMEEAGHPEFQRWLRDLCASRLVRPDDRELFGLESLSDTTVAAGEPAGSDLDPPTPPLGSVEDVLPEAL